MSRRLSSSAWFWALLLLAGPLSLRAQFTWLGLSPTDGNITDGRNWTPSAPTGVGSESLTFGTSGPQINVLVPTSAFSNISFTAGRPGYTFSGTGGSPVLTLAAAGGVTVTAGSTVTFASSLGFNLATGVLTGDDHTFNIAAATTLQINGVLSGGGHLSKTGTGTLVLTGANTYNYTGGLGFLDSTSIHAGTVHLDGGSILHTGTGDVQISLNAGDNATLLIDNGGHINDYFGVLAQGSGSTATATVSGSSSYWTNSSGIDVGYSGNGTLLITNGGTVTVADIYSEIGYGGSSVGTVTVDGAGSLWTNAGPLHVGNFGSGSLTIANGGTVGVNNGAGIVTLGVNSGGSGTLNIGAAVAGPAAAGGSVNAASITTGSGTGTLQFNTTATSGTPYYLTKNGTSAGAAVTVTGATKLINTAGYNVLTGANTYTGGTTINAGTLQIGAGGTSGSITGNVTDNGALTFNRGDAITYGGVISGTGTLTQRGAGTLTLSGANTFTGGTTVDFGTLKVAGGSIGSATAFTVIGNATGDNGTLAITTGGTVSSNNTNIGSQTGSLGTVTVDGTGSSWTNAGFLRVGQAGDGTLGVSNQGVVSSNAITIGDVIGGTGRATIDGAGSSLASANNLAVGFSGSGSLTITNGGTASAAINGIVAQNGSGSSGSVYIDGATSTWTVGNGLFVGFAGTGSLSLVNGGSVKVNSGAGTVTLGGNGGAGTLNIGAVSYIPAAAGGVVNTASITGGPGPATLQFNTTATSGTPYYLTKDGTSSGTAVTVTGATQLINTGGYNVLTGANTYTGGTTIHGGTLQMNGGSISHPAADLSVGAVSGDNGFLNIFGGGAISNATSNVGLLAGSTGTATVSGAGSSWTDSTYLYVGEAGIGTLAITSGGTVSSPNTSIGNNTGGVGTVTIDGAGSTLANSANLYVGSAGGGSLAITNGGHATNVIGSIGNNTGGGGAVTVDGAGSVWTNTGDLFVGDGATTGTLSASNGGVVNSANGYVAYPAATSGYAYVTGVGSTWNVANSLYVGYQGSGVFYLNGNGILNVAGGTGTVNLGNSIGALGQFFIGSEGGLGGVVDAATITTGSGSGVVSFQTSTTSASPYYLTKDGTATGVPVIIAGPTSVSASGGYIVLSGANTYTGGTFITSGTLVVAANGALGTGTVNLNSSAGTLNVASGITLSNPLVFSSGGILAGNGTFGTAVSVGTGVALSPGNSPGNLTFNSGLTFAPGGTLNFEVQSAAGPTGAGYDLVSVSGAVLNITASSGSPFTLKLISLNLAGTAGPVSDFSAASSYSWTVATSVAGITNFSANNFIIDTSSFSNSLGIGSFSLLQGVSGGNPALFLNFTPVPEPSTYALLVTGLAFVGFGYRRQKLSSRRS